ncbi:MAG TPA: phosphosulfolactate synthase, partial [Solirubrobacteraceae bacterium]|nr:phosphosulfolactate synthase [Solirubrobacteraceae bacterium]
MRELLNLPERSGKPRSAGITHVIDRGLSAAEIDGMIEVAGEFIDIVKLGWGTALATQNLERK